LDQRKKSREKKGGGGRLRTIGWKMGVGIDSMLSSYFNTYLIHCIVDSFEAIAPVVGKWMKNALPANTTVVSQLVAPEMKIEIEVTASMP